MTDRNYTFLSAMRDIATGRAEFASEPVFLKRLDTCTKCPDFAKLSKQCKKCGCFVYAKAKFKPSNCPNGFWEIE